ncbi:uncharacterized protein K452DRAFT_289632 [Aplosporella prunicola CBS 121167]|uniref:Uncharacterized protein n=1 Tax=Aplosporella prunicola CBS 121167 TaxID=1176127 RepID=A0A6A6B677_9PEZI|nr:uncharacterized protein K452DRAFT_289632 [Aplosporella prunicola CBS 121167]KAF2139632.1 hypothetical protein K452DRAFT_289632 [Aplosporella prunicola CBS 121167]
MPPIPIYSNAPINPNTAAATADGVTPQTDSNLNDQQGQQHPPPTRIVPASVPATTTQGVGSQPAAPQPGAVPIPPPPSTTTATATSAGVPPAPQPGQAPSIATATATAPAPTHAAHPPPQFSIPAPQANAAPTSSTTASAAAYPAGPTTINLGPAPGGAAPSPAETGATATREQRRSLEHPPGYVQNPYAADGTAEQRARMEAAAQQQQEEGGLWGSMRAAAAKVGEGLKKGEEEAWKLVGGSGGKGGSLGG